MAVFPLGTQITLSCSIRNVDGVLADATEVTCTVTFDDEPVALSVTHAGTGLYSTTITPTEVGEYDVSWVATGLNACTLYQTFEVMAYASAATVDEIMLWLPEDMTDDEKNRWVTMYSDPHQAAGMAWQSWAARLKSSGEDVAVTNVSTGAQSIGYGTPTSPSERAMAAAQWHFARCRKAVLSPDYNHTPAVPLSGLLPPTWKEV